MLDVVTPDAGAYAADAEVLIDEGRPAQALALAEKAVLLAPDAAQGFAARARARRALGDRDGALADLDALIARHPGSALAHDARAVLKAEAGRLDEARADFLAALARNPALARAHFGLASLGRVAPAHLAAMEALAAAGLDAAARVFLLYALAKAYDEAGDAARAFACAEAGARLRPAPSPAEAAEALRRIETAGPPAGGGGRSRKAPIFVFGLPRSGTTLVEQILASHPEVHALGEIELFARAGDAAGYLAGLPEAARTARRIVDKSLGNALEIGAILRAFPRARLVHVRRDPADNALSIFLTLFAGRMPFPLDPAGIGRYIAAHGAMMARWRAALGPEVLHEIEYERLVSDAEGETRALLAFCGLRFSPRCLRFHQTRRPVATASLAQVRAPLYASAVGRARRYAAWLPALEE